MSRSVGLIVGDDTRPGQAGTASTEEAVIDTRTALVGGGGTGIGRAAAERLAAAGHRVVLFGRTEDTLRSAAAGIAADTGADVSYLVGDLTGPGAPTGVAADADVLVLNGGGPTPGRILQVDDAAWHAGTDLLLVGPLRLARAALPRMAERGFGRVVFVTSTAVKKPEADLAVSVVLRSAVTAAAKLLSLEYAAHGVTVNCVAPGATATARREEILTARAAASGMDRAVLEQEEALTVPAGRAGEPGEIGDAIAFLASDRAGYVNGTVLTVDGGRTEAIW